MINENNDLVINGELRSVINFVKQHTGCNYIIVSDEIKKYETLIKDVPEVISNRDFCNIENKDIDSMDGACYCYTNNTLYVGIPNKSDEFTISRSLTHEYGHYLQNTKNFNISNCDETLLEYHNILINENPNNKNKKRICVRIDSITGFRFSYSGHPIPLDKSNYRRYDKLFSLEFNNFYNEIISTKTRALDKNGSGNNRKLLQEIYDYITKINKENYARQDYYRLFHNFMHDV